MSGEESSPVILEDSSEAALLDCASHACAFFPVEAMLRRYACLFGSGSDADAEARLAQQQSGSVAAALQIGAFLLARCVWQWPSHRRR